jgi:KaiC/GvpD/RAD55 family RecA-like ATPase
MADENWRERFRVSDAEMERLQNKITEIAKALYAEEGSQIDSISVTFHFISGTPIRLLEVSVAGSEPHEISDDAEMF